MMTSSDHYDGPPSVPPSRSRKEIFDQFDQFRKADRRAAETIIDLDSRIDETLTYLTNDLTSDAEKARAIFAFISRLLFVRANKNNKDETTLAGFLNLNASGERNWSNVFVLLCRKANLKSVLLRGYCKGNDSYAQPDTPVVNSHWTAVHIDGHWRLVHLLMAFRHSQMKCDPFIKIETDGSACKERDTQYIIRVDDDYFFSDPGDFIFMCRPEDDRWQLLETPWDWKTYITAPKYRPLQQQPQPQPQPPPPPPKPLSRPPPLPVKSIPNINIEDMEGGFPKPSPSTSQAAVNPNWKNFVNIDDRAKRVPIDKMRHYDDLFRYLFEDLKDNIQKVRLIFIWVGKYCNSYTVSSEDLREIEDPYTPLGLIKITRQYKLCNELCFAAVCRRANIPCVAVRGSSKRPYGYCFEDVSKTCTLSEAVWNAVYVDGNWRLINLREAKSYETRREIVTVDIYGKERKQISIISEGQMSGFFFMPNPEDFVHFCLPHNQDWQLLKNPVSKERFVNQPVFHPEYFLSRWRLPACDAIVHAKNGISELTFLNSFTEESNDQASGTCLQDTFFRYDLFFREDSNNEFPDDLKISNHIFFKNDKNMKTVIVRFPINGVYLLLFKNTANNKVCELLLKCSGITGKQPEIPYSPDLEKNGLGVVKDSRYVVQDSFKESIIEVQPGEKVFIPLIFKRKRKSSKGTVHSCKVEEKMIKTVGNISAEINNYQASLVGSGGTLTDTKICVHITPQDNEDYVRIAVQVPPVNMEIVVIVKAAIRGREKENVANFLLTHDDRLQGRNWRKHTNEQKKEIRKLEKDGKKHKVTPSRSSKLLQLYQREFVHAELFDDVKELESVFADAKKSIVAQDIYQTPWFGNAKGELRNLRLEEFKKKTKEKEKNIECKGRSRKTNRQHLMDLFRKEFECALDLQDLVFLEELFALTKESLMAHHIQQTLWFLESQKCCRQLQRQLFRQEKRRFEKAIMKSTNSGLANHHRLIKLYQQEFRQSLEYDDRKDLEETFALAKSSNVLYFINQTPWYYETRDRLRNLRRQYLTKKKLRLERAFKKSENKKIEEKLKDLYRKEFIQAQEFGIPEDLQYALKSASKSVLAHFLTRSVEYVKTTELLQILERHCRMNVKVDEPSVKDVEEMRSLVHPHQLVQNIVKATFLILGEKEKNVREWRQVQTLLRERDSLIERIKNSKAEDIQTRHMYKASKLLGTCNHQDISSVSPTAADFYIWLKGLIEQKIQQSEGDIEEQSQEESINYTTGGETSDDTDDETDDEIYY